MGSPPAPLIANCWISKFDPILRDNAVFFSRYLDDVVREIKKNSFEDKVKSINNCLLYTSPSPRDGLLSRMPSSA